MITQKVGYTCCSDKRYGSEEKTKQRNERGKRGEEEATEEEKQRMRRGCEGERRKENEKRTWG